MGPAKKAKTATCHPGPPVHSLGSRTAAAPPRLSYGQSQSISRPFMSLSRNTAIPPPSPSESLFTHIDPTPPTPSASMQPPTAIYTPAGPPPIQPVATPGVSIRRDNRQDVSGEQQFQEEVIQVIRTGLSRLQGKCIVCLLLGENKAETHTHAGCNGPYMKTGMDSKWGAFVAQFDVKNKQCYGCYVRSVS